MTISIDKLLVRSKAVSGTSVGTLGVFDSTGVPVPCTFNVDSDRMGFFNISNSTLLTQWATPATPGNYPVRIVAIDKAGFLVEDALFTVQVTAPVPSILVNGAANASVKSGTQITISVADGSGDPRSWVGLAVSGSPANSFLTWAYLNGLRMPPVTGLESATITLTAPTPANAYEARLYVDDRFTILAKSPFTIAP
jgi:hypothetical protein